MDIIKITKDNFEAEVLNSDKPVLVDFYAEWCQPCRMMKPILLDVTERMGDAVSILTIDVDKEKELAAQHRIQSVTSNKMGFIILQGWHHSA